MCASLNSHPFVPALNRPGLRSNAQCLNRQLSVKPDATCLIRPTLSFVSTRRLSLDISEQAFKTLSNKKVKANLEKKNEHS